MYRFLEYYGRFEVFRGSFGRLPGWARIPVLLAALPGLVLVGLSVVVFVVSILALLLLTVPVWRVMQLVAGSQRPEDGLVGPADDPQGRRRHVDVTIIEEK
jgi:hypothetical protein